MFSATDLVCFVLYWRKYKITWCQKLFELVISTFSVVKNLNVISLHVWRIAAFHKGPENFFCIILKDRIFPFTLFLLNWQVISLTIQQLKWLYQLYHPTHKLTPLAFKFWHLYDIEHTWSWGERTDYVQTAALARIISRSLAL